MGAPDVSSQKRSFSIKGPDGEPASAPASGAAVASSPASLPPPLLEFRELLAPPLPWLDMPELDALVDAPPLPPRSDDPLLAAPPEKVELDALAPPPPSPPSDQG